MLDNDWNYNEFPSKAACHKFHINSNRDSEKKKNHATLLAHTVQPEFKVRECNLVFAVTEV